MRRAPLVLLVALAGCTCRRAKDEARATTNEQATKARRLRTIASGQVQPFGIALDETDVWWTNKGRTRRGDGALMKAAKSGGAPTVVVDRLFTPYGIAFVDGYAYWTEYDSAGGAEHGVLAHASKDGANRTTDVFVLHAPWAIASSSGVVFFTELQGHRVDRYRPPSDGEGTMDVVAEGQSKPLGLAADADAVYWSDADVGVVLRAELSGSPPAVIANSLKKPAEIAIDDAYVYWAELDGRSIGRAPKKGGPVETLARGDFHPRSVAVDDHFVWFVAAKEGLVLRAPKSGGAVDTIASGQKGPYSIAVDAQSVYWTNSDDGTVMAVDKE